MSVDQVHPAIAANGYELLSVAQFLERAPEPHLDRYARDCRGMGQFIIWDPNDDESGFMLCLPTISGLNEAFLAHFGEFLS